MFHDTATCIQAYRRSELPQTDFLTHMLADVHNHVKTADRELRHTLIRTCRHRTATIDSVICRVTKARYCAWHSPQMLPRWSQLPRTAPGESGTSMCAIISRKIRRPCCNRNSRSAVAAACLYTNSLLAISHTAKHIGTTVIRFESVCFHGLGCVMQRHSCTAHLTIAYTGYIHHLLLNSRVCAFHTAPMIAHVYTMLLEHICLLGPDTAHLCGITRRRPIQPCSAFALHHE